MTGVTTDRGTVKAQQVINCGGMWARQFGALCGVSIPNQAAGDCGGSWEMMSCIIIISFASSLLLSLTCVEQIE